MNGLNKKHRPSIYSVLVLTLLGVVALSACGHGTPAPTITVIKASSLVPEGVVPAGSVLVGPSAGLSEENKLLTSADGSHWTPSVLPVQPQHMAALKVEKAGTLVIASARALLEPIDPLLPNGPMFVWTTHDGMNWQGGKIDIELSDGFADLVSIGDLLVIGGSKTGGPLNVLTSHDHAKTWRHAGVRAPTFNESQVASIDGGWSANGNLFTNLDYIGSAALGKVTETTNSDGTSKKFILESTDEAATWTSHECTNSNPICQPQRVAGSLHIRGNEVSLNNGKTWKTPTVDVKAIKHSPPQDPQSIPSGGWIGSAVDKYGKEQSESYLLRSDNGISWKEMLPHNRCPLHEHSQGGYPTPIFSKGHWYTMYSCFAGTELSFAHVYQANADAKHWKELPQIHIGKQQAADLFTFKGNFYVGIFGSNPKLIQLLRIDPNLYEIRCCLATR